MEVTDEVIFESVNDLNFTERERLIFKLGFKKGETYAINNLSEIILKLLK